MRTIIYWDFAKLLFINARKRDRYVAPETPHAKICYCNLATWDIRLFRYEYLRVDAFTAFNKSLFDLLCNAHALVSNG